ncbi:PREDICTED: uncharacterized protein LOC106788994 isoform X1 [Polistes canadensis]|uniref:uncharacterized protein LOC106788994 isoform X1 n=1 Tax=Polistes canadensis TaxID=91411 RepID=UPI000718F473|nr:PREDICTED: uncharacterized protein LOC106788994 isoform X1 [Polistes canadensis]
MSFVLQLDAMENNSDDKTKNGSAASSSMLIDTQELTSPLTIGVTTTANTLVAMNDDNSDSNNPQVLQCLEVTNVPKIAVTHSSISLSNVKSVSVSYPVNKTNKEVSQRVSSSSQTNTTQVSTTRVISQKSPCTAYINQPLTLNASSIVTQLSVNSQSLPSPSVAHVYPMQAAACTQNNQQSKTQTQNTASVTDASSKKQQATTVGNLQTTNVHTKFQQISPQQILNTATVKTITTATNIPNIQRIQVKGSNLNGQPQTVNLQKVKAVANLSNPTMVQRNTVSRFQAIQKSQVLASTAQGTQFTVNQIFNNANVQRIQTSTSSQKVQSINSTNSPKMSQVYNNQKTAGQQLVTNHTNHKVQHQQYQNNQQVPPALQKVQGQQQKSLPIQRQNNVQKSNNSVGGIQKSQISGQIQNQHQPPQLQKQGQQSQSSQHQRSQSAIALNKSQTLTALTSNRVQTITNVCKSNSVPNISKVPHNSNAPIASKQQQGGASQSQQSHVQTSTQLQPQLLQTSQQQHVTQKQQTVTTTPHIQRNHNITNIHQKVSTITTIPSNHKTQTIVNSKMQQQQQQQQQQMVMRVGVSKNQAQNLQQGNLKTIPQKITNTIKSPNSQNSLQQSLHRNNNSQPVKIIQQQQNVIGPQNTQKQPGCIKTIPPQKPAQRNHAQKVSGFKSSSNNVTAIKNQGLMTSVSQKTSIKTLLPQQTVMQNMLVHKSSPIKVQQQAIQQKQLIMASQYSQQGRTQTGQIKTLLSTTNTEVNEDLDNKMEADSCLLKVEEIQKTPPKSPIRRMPLPYECLQFVLQDHNYGAPPPRTPPPPSPPPHPKQQAINGAGSSTTTSQHSYLYGQVVNNSSNVEDDAASAISSEPGREVEPEGEETETAAEGEGDDEDSVTRCICDFEHDDGYMICCDRCLVWQHVDCMGIDRSNIPDEYLCEICKPRRVDRQRARTLQMRKREELLNSDSSSDTSSASSVDTDIGVNQTQKKRLHHQISRRKSDPPPQVRRLNNNNNNNNNNVGKRQRRDSNPRQSSAVRKKETTKRGPGKRKTKRRGSADEKEEEFQDAWGSSNMTPLRQWIERYEEAVTNHYSPELRARISSIKVNGTHCDLRQSNMNVIATGKCRLNVHSNNLRFLAATMYLSPNTPVVELRGKYMLSTQHRPSHPQGRQHAQRPGPFVFFYRLPRDGTEVCVDTRTYGNDARFVRRSCKPNAEIKHCIEKGTLHLYIVTSMAIEKNAEITIRHEPHDLLLSPNPNSPVIPVTCACNNTRECQFTTTNQFNRRGSNGTVVENADGRERRRRGRRNTICEDSDSVPTVSSTNVTPLTTQVPTATPVTAPPKKTIATSSTTTVTRQLPKEETQITTQQQQPLPQSSQTSPALPQPTVQEMKKDKKKMTREERKMEAIMKAFERLEKAEQRKQEVQARNAQRKESGGTHSDNEDSHNSVVLQAKTKQQNSERTLRRKKRKGRARTSSQSQSTRRTRLNSADSDVSSGDESNSMQSPPLATQNRSSSGDASYSVHLNTPAKNGNDGSTTTGTSGGGGHQGIQTAAGLLLALANSNTPGPSSPPLQQPTPVKSPTCDSGASSSSQSSTPSTPLSSACLLVAAAVGPLAPGFKFPKTKKVLMNEWLKESPDPPQTNIPQVTPITSISSTSLQNSVVNPLCRSSEFSLPNDPSAEFLTQSYAAKSLATLVQAANSVSGICDSPPQRKQMITGNNACPVSTGSAKKRWLRQAISEECDSPNSRPESPPPSERVAPPKKRRIARESLSSDNYTPPTTPTMLLPEVVSTNRSLCNNEEYHFIEQPQSPTMEHNGEQHDESEFTNEKNVKNSINKSELTCNRDKLSNNNLSTEGNSNSEKSDEIKEFIKIEETGSIKQDGTLINEESYVKSEIFDANVNSKVELHLSPTGLIKNEEKIVKRETMMMHDFQVQQNALIKKEDIIKEEINEKGTVEIIDQNEPDTEMEDFSSPNVAMESDVILNQRVAEMRLEFGGSIADIVNISNEQREKSADEDDRQIEINKDSEMRSEDNTSIDEFDVEAQMKRITGDDGNDYKEKVDTSSEKDKSMDGIEGLMESSKEDSESEDNRDMDDGHVYCEPFKLFAASNEDNFPEYKSKSSELTNLNVEEVKVNVKPNNNESQKIEQASSSFVISSEESIFESTSSNMDAESVPEPPFQSIPPLSERIRKKTDPPSNTKTQLNFEAAIIESTIDMEAEEVCKNGEDKSMLLSTVLRELLEAKLEDELSDESTNKVDNEDTTTSYKDIRSLSPENTGEVKDSSMKCKNNKETHLDEVSVKQNDVQPKEIKRLKDPRTVVPNNLIVPSSSTNAPLPVKRKVRTLSISEYRKRKQQSTGTPPEPEPSNDVSTIEKDKARGRSDSASSGTSSLSSDEEGSKISLDLPGITALPLFTNAENDEKKGSEEGTIGWSAAPTLVERQRENLTERLKREFGLFLSDDEEERARKHGLTAEAILKARRTSPPYSLIPTTSPTFPLPHLPPHPYIPPPGSSTMHYPQFQANKSCPSQYSNFSAPQTTLQTVYPNVTSQGTVNKPVQFLVPQAASQAPPGSNPYPPQFIPTTTTTVPISKFSSATSTSGTTPHVFSTSAQTQKPFFNHPAPRS